MLYVLNHSLHHYMDEEAHAYFMLCMHGYQALGRNLPLAHGIAQSIIAIAVRLGILLPKDARTLSKDINAGSTQAKEFMSTYPIDLYTAPTNLEASTLEALVQDFEQLGLNRPDKVVERESTPKGWKGNRELLLTTLGEYKVNDQFE